MVKRKESQKGEMKEDFEGHSKAKRGILAVCGGSDSVESWGGNGYICAHRRPLKPLCWSFFVLVGDYQGEGVRRPQKAGTETEAEGVPKMWRQRRSAWNRGQRDDRGTELRKSGKVGGKSVKCQSDRGRKSVKK